MMKKTIISLLTAVAGIISHPTAAQTVTGTWEMLPGYSTPTKIVETPEYVYVQSASSLCGYDKTTGEVLALNATNRLNGNNVKNFWYNPEEGYMFVLHTDENIDLVYDDGRTINVPDLRDATITVDKTVQDVGFAGGKAYVGTKSGMIVIDAEHGAVTESTLWGKNVIAIAATEKKIIMWIGWADGGMYVANRAGSHHNFEQSFTKSTSGVYPNADQRYYEHIGANKILAVNGGVAYVITVDDNATDNATACTNNRLADAVVGTAAIAVPTKDGVMMQNGDKLFYIGADGTLKKTVTVAEANGKLAADRNGTADKVWLADAGGYGQYDVAASSYAITPVRPSGTSGTNVGMLRQASNGDIYISTLPRIPVTGSADGQASKFDIWSPKTGVTPLKWNSPTNLYSMIINPNNENELIASFRTSVRRFNTETNTEFVYSTANTPFVSGLLFNDVKVDNDGNLWVLHISGGTKPIIYKALAGSWETDVKTEGWSRYEIPNFSSGDHTPRFAIDEKNRIIVITGTSTIAAVQMPATNAPLSQSSIQSFAHSLFIDSDGLTTTLGHTPTITVDHNNWIWCGTPSGVFFVADAKQMMQTNYNVSRPKVARNDGTNLADFLLDNVTVVHISVDENNEKWISTIGSGLYRVNADGTQIIERYHTGNSDIPSDNVYCALADKNSNKVFVGTDKGLSIFHATTAPAHKDYSEVYAYPNPVTPDYTGYITITGLKADSLVKIADAAGNVFYETKSDGGLATWNGCDASGRRVRSGVYFVFASQSGENISSSGAVTKIVVVN